MTERFEEDLGKYTYVTLAQVKDYLTISSSTFDARISNIIHYATGAIEHYIGQGILANNYSEIFDGGRSSVFVSRLPLTKVYSVQEFDGIGYITLNAPTSQGTPVTSSADSIIFNNVGNPVISKHIKKLNNYSIQLGILDAIVSSSVPAQLQLEQSDFTIEAYVRIDEETLQDNAIFSLNTADNNYCELALSNQYGLSFQSVSPTTTVIVQGANTLIESQQFNKRRWAHVAVTRVLEDEKLYLFYNGNKIADASYAVEEHSFTSNVLIGESFKGYMDEIRVSTTARYIADFTPSAYRFSTDENTVLLIHMDNANLIEDSHAKPNEYSYSVDVGEITKDISNKGVASSYGHASISGPPLFAAYPSSVKVSYRAGYEADSVPYDLQLAAMDYIKMLYKQDQDKKSFSFEGESGEKNTLVGNFPPHIRRILDLYRVIS